MTAEKENEPKKIVNYITQTITIRLMPDELALVDGLVRMFYPRINGRASAIKLLLAIVNKIDPEQLKELAKDFPAIQRGRPAK